MDKYCAECGSPLVMKQLPTEDRPRLVCVAAGHVTYINPRIVSGTLPVSLGKIWLLRRGIEPRIGYWTYPAGYQEVDESTEEAAVRETLEEIGLRVTDTSLFGVYSHGGSRSVNVVYLARHMDASDVPTLTTEATEIAQFGPDEIPWAELAFPSTTLILEDWVASTRRVLQLRRKFRSTSPPAQDS